MSCSDDDTEVKEAEVPTFHGNYIGSWISSASNGKDFNVSVSAIINESSTNQWSGSFFISSNYTSCCSTNDNDGTIQFTMIDSVITDFQYNDTVQGCPGKFEGGGVLNQDGSITIDFTGEDCDGEHSGAQIKLFNQS